MALPLGWLRVMTRRNGRTGRLIRSSGRFSFVQSEQNCLSKHLVYCTKFDTLTPHLFKTVNGSLLFWDAMRCPVFTVLSSPPVLGAAVLIALVWDHLGGL